MAAFTARGAEAISIPTNGWYDDRTLATLGRFLDADGTDHRQPQRVGRRLRPPRPGAGRAGVRAPVPTLRRLEPLQATHRNLRVRLNTVVTSDNVADVRALIDWFAATYDQLDEHALEVVRTHRRGGRPHLDRPARPRRPLRRAHRPRRPHLPGPPTAAARCPASRKAWATCSGAAHAAAAAAVKRDRINGKRWGFPRTAGQRIAVVDGEGTLKACEHRGVVVDLAAEGWDLSAALASSAMAAERRSIRADACDCIHGCFVGNSLQHSPRRSSAGRSPPR